MNNVKLLSLKAKDYAKEQEWIRFLCTPLYRVKRNLKNRRYEHSEDSQRIKKFYGIYHGKKCVIVGNGPSLRLEELERLNGVKCFASNRIYNIYDKTTWRPDFYVAFEPYFVSETMDIISQLEVKEAKFINLVGKGRVRRSQEDMYWLNCYSKFMTVKHTTSNIRFSTDLSEYVADAYTVTYTAIQIAVYMGFKEIYLLGIDHFAPGKSFEHFYEDKKTDYKTYTYVEGIEYGYRVAKREAEKLGVKIYNATRGGKLEVFERVDFDDLIKGGGVIPERVHPILLREYASRVSSLKRR